MIQGYQIDEIIHEDDYKMVCHAYSIQMACSVVLKVVKDASSNPMVASKLMNEYEMVSRSNKDGIVKAYALERHGVSLVLVLEDTKGISLRKYLNGGRLELSVFLVIAVQLADMLRELHEDQVIHQDLKLDNLIIELETLKVKATDFGNAVSYAMENLQSGREQALEGSLPYISPEQTGRMNRAVDYRTDFYSMGVVFYEMLSGQLPFAAKDPTALIHAHLAISAAPLTERVSGIPAVVSGIVAKLMSKNVQDRYQSAFGLCADLEQCLSDWQRQGNVDHFSLGQRDMTQFFRISSKLYGRERELELIMNSFRWMHLGSTQMLLITGQGGIGKTALVNEIQKQFIQEKGYFISGKFEQMHHDAPYEPLIRAFRDLIRQILTERQEQIEEWKDKLYKALGANMVVIAGVIPDIELLTGEPSLVQTLPQTELQHRFPLVFRDFVQVFLKPEHPIILFLDDLQWVDPASLKLIQALISGSEAPSLLFIGAYRDQEVDRAHSLSLAIHDMEALGVDIHEIRLAPLTLPDMNALVSDTLSASATETMGLSEELFRKSAGNPFFFKQLFQTVHTEQWLRYVAKRGVWEWDLPAIEHMPVSGGLLEFMMERTARQPKNVQRVISLAACFGGRFHVPALAEILQVPVNEVAMNLQNAVHEGFVIPQDGNGNQNQVASGAAEGIHKDYIFLHDRIEQAAYSLLDEDSKRNFHLQIGRFIQKHTAQDDRNADLFDSVYHLNKGADLITKPDEIMQLISLNLMAGRKAKLSSAYEAALAFLRKGAEMLWDELWTSRFELCFDLNLELAECEYLSGHYEHADALFAMLDIRSRDRRDRSRVSLIRIRRYVGRGKYTEAIEAGLERLREFHIQIPLKPGIALIAGETIATRWRLRRSSRNRLADLPEMTDKDSSLVMDLLLTMMAPSFFKNIGLCVVLVCKAVKMSLKYGNHPFSSVAYICFGIATSFLLKDMRTGYQLGRIAVTLADKSDWGSVISKTGVLFGGILSQWVGHAREGDAYLTKSLQRGLESGDYIFASFAMISHVNSLYMRETLGSLSRTIVQYMEIIDKTRDPYVKQNLLLYRQFIQAMQGKTENPLSFNEETFDEEQYLIQVSKGDTAATTLFQYYTFKIQLSYLTESYEQALQYAQAVKPYAFYAQELPHNSECRYYESLSISTLLSTDGTKDKRRLWKRLRTNLNKMKRWSKQSPENFLHKVLLMEAEIARLRGNHTEAAERYDQAIQAARDNGYIQHKAIANERAALYYSSLGRDKVAFAYAEDAYRFFSKWGAAVKIGKFTERFPQVRPGASQANKDRPPSSSVQPLAENSRRDMVQDAIVSVNSTGSSMEMDLAVIMKITQVVSNEIDLEQCIRKLMFFIMEGTGAQKGCLVLVKDGKLVVEIAVEAGAEWHVLAENTALNNCFELSQGIIQYTARTQDIVILDDAANAGLFVHDPYVAGHKTKSVLGFPVIVQGRSEGILYLENNLVAGAFASERLNLLRMLSTQVLYVRKLIDSIERESDPLQLVSVNIKDNGVEPLTEREIMVLNLMAAGLSNQEIGERLVIAAGTVKVHIKNIFAKLKVNRRIKAVSLAKEMDLLKDNKV